MEVPLGGVDAATTETGEPTFDPGVGVQISTPAVAGAPQAIPDIATLFFEMVFNTSTVTIVRVCGPALAVMLLRSWFERL